LVLNISVRRNSMNIIRSLFCSYFNREQKTIKKCCGSCPVCPKTWTKVGLRSTCFVNYDVNTWALKTNDGSLAASYDGQQGMLNVGTKSLSYQGSKLGCTPSPMIELNYFVNFEDMRDLKSDLIPWNSNTTHDDIDYRRSQCVKGEKHNWMLKKVIFEDYEKITIGMYVLSIETVMILLESWLSFILDNIGAKFEGSNLYYVRSCEYRVGKWLEMNSKGWILLVYVCTSSASCVLESESACLCRTRGPS
jgi:hypothetical protein